LEVSRETLFAISGEVLLLPAMKRKQWNDRVPTALNFGLNFIDVANAQIVPRFVRGNFSKENTRVPQKMFDDLEFSRSALSLLQCYLATFPWLVELLEDNRSPKLRKEFRAAGLFGKEQDPNIRLYREFIKLYDLDSKGFFCSFYSKTADLDSLPNIFTEKKGSNSIVTLQYHEVISRRLGLQSPPAFTREPEYHDIGARVVLLGSLEVGYVVCIDDQWVHVVVGKEKRREKVRFTEAFNECWGSALSSEPGKCWNMEVGYFTPTYWRPALQ
jgi:hypothetical protein